MPNIMSIFETNGKIAYGDAQNVATFEYISSIERMKNKKKNVAQEQSCKE